MSPQPLLTHPTLGDLTPIVLQWRAVEDRFKHWQQVEASFDPSEPSDRAHDCSGEAGVLSYAAASNYLTAAHDHHTLLYTLIRSEMPLSPFAPWSPLRALFETSFLARWILGPEDPQQRVKNGLAMVLDEQRQHGNRLKINRKLRAPSANAAELAELDKTDAVYTAAKDRFNAIAEPYGMSMRSTGVPLVKQIQETTVFSDEGKLIGEQVWRLCSSLQHADMAALFSVSQNAPSDSTAEVKVDFDAESFLFAYGLSLELFAQAIGEMVVRSTVVTTFTPPPPTAPRVKRPRKKKTDTN